MPSTLGIVDNDVPVIGKELLPDDIVVKVFAVADNHGGGGGDFLVGLEDKVVGVLFWE